MHIPPPRQHFDVVEENPRTFHNPERSNQSVVVIAEEEVAVAANITNDEETPTNVMSADMATMFLRRRSLPRCCPIVRYENNNEL
jgi:hypothetical protein